MIERERIENLTEVLADLHEDRVSEDQALEKIREASPREISIAEQELFDRGYKESELKEFCKIHLKAIEEKVNEIKSSLEEDHPIRVLIVEHEKIQKYLDDLEELSQSLKDGLDEDEKQKLREVAENLVESEKHHEREEEVIFPRLEEKGIDGPPRIMREDHDEFKPKKRELLRLSENPNKNKQEILDLADFLTFNLRDHIFKENNILYPSALEELEDWDVMKEEGNKIGLCSFVPMSKDS